MSHNKIPQKTSQELSVESPSPKKANKVAAEITPSVQRWQKIAHGTQMVLQPVIAVGAIVLLAVGFSVAQKNGYFLSADSQGEPGGVTQSDIEYVCPMLCVSPVKEPGRCPVCAMELKARIVSGDPKDLYGLTIAPAARRLSNIQTVMATSKPIKKTIKAFGKIAYDETSESTIAAYVNGRLERLFVDFTGAHVDRGQALAMIYSPDLYSAQVELLQARKALSEEPSDRQRIVDANRRMYESARQRLLEFGLPESQLQSLETSGKADSRIQITSPVSGTVVKKMVDEGEYLKTGTPILQVVDLSRVWLVVQLFPEDASLVRFGQQVDVVLQSQMGKEFTGRIAFIDSEINPQTQTIPVRVVIPNEAGLIRVGDYAEIRSEVPVDSSGGQLNELYDPQLAGKWISPRHPYIIRDEPGICPVCGEELLDASSLGFVEDPPGNQMAVVVPRESVLVSGDESVAYVETSPGHFEFRQVKIGPVAGEQVAIVSGIKSGEMVVANAAFMVDAAFNMSGKPSLIDPNRAAGKDESKQAAREIESAKIEQAFAQLDDTDRALARAQRLCPVTGFDLGSMGTPVKVIVQGKAVFMCCEGCRTRLLEEPDRYLEILKHGHPLKHEEPLTAKELEDIEKALQALSVIDRQLAEKQKYCPVAEMRLGSMGPPIKVDLQGVAVFVCCSGCRESLVENADKYLEKMGKLPTRSKPPTKETLGQ
ncbi:MAG: efflux RND transporter periplasmic adaptor subunit [Mariniblastus sp.]|nr:efflux RND transporter periplasmic adaptor subunit [Mariniblastus sp.]